MRVTESWVESLRLTVVIAREDDRYVAQCKEVDVASFGDTRTRRSRW